MKGAVYMERLEKKQRQREYWYENNNIDTDENLQRVLLLAQHKLGYANRKGYTIAPKGFYPVYLEVTYMTRKYKLEVNKDEMCVVLLSQNMANNKNGKEYYHIMVMNKNGDKAKFGGDTCWEKALDMLANKMKIYGFRQDEEGAK